MKRREGKVLSLVLTALFAALICVATMLVRIPVPATGGYANLGDGVLLIGAFLMHPVCAAAAAGIGSMLADMLAGYMQFAIGTLVIKMGMAYIAASIFQKISRAQQGKREFYGMVGGALIAEVMMIAGYFVFEAVFLGYGMGAAGSILGNAGQGIVGAVVGCIVAPVLRKNNEVTSLMNKT